MNWLNENEKIVCNGCLSKRLLKDSRDGCFYMYKPAYDRLYKNCPCSTCVVKIICEHKFNKCEKFAEFLKDGIVVMTKEAKQDNDLKKMCIMTKEAIQEIDLNGILYSSWVWI
jgi:hypothetical protein